MKDSHEKIRRFMIAFNRIDALYVDSVRTFGVKGNLFVLFYAIADGKAYSQRQICDDWKLPRTTLNTIVRECVKEQQAFARAHRIGQKRDVHVYKLICKQTVEEKVLELQEMKRELSEGLEMPKLRVSEMITLLEA